MTGIWWAQWKAVGKAELGTMAVVRQRKELSGGKSSEEEIERIQRVQEMLGFEEVQNNHPQAKGFT